MHADFEALLHEAEAHYLQEPDIMVFKRNYISLQERLKVYKCLRDQELAIFQPIADPLLEACPNAHAKDIERALRHWIAIVRYAAMAMLLNNPEFLRRRVLEWLTDIVQAHELVEIEQKLYELMVQQMKTLIPQTQFFCLLPFLEQAKQALLNPAPGNPARQMAASRN